MPQCSGTLKAGVLFSGSYLLDRERVVFQRLLPFTDYQESLVRRTGVVGAIKNCCFDTGEQRWTV